MTFHADLNADPARFEKFASGGHDLFADDRSGIFCVVSEYRPINTFIADEISGGVFFGGVVDTPSRNLILTDVIG